MSPELQIIYALDDEPGLSRRRAGKGFRYLDERGRSVDKKTRRRIEGLVIPPAWEEVWICPDLRGHIQATGRDVKGRKQYIYHPSWRSWRERSKFVHVLDFAASLPKLRERVARDLGNRQLSQDLVVATAVRILERTLMRVGNDEYARHNQSYGLTTLLGEHVELAGSRLRFSFRGKHGKTFDAEFSDRRVAAVLRRMEGLPGQHLLQFMDESGEPRRVTSDDVNTYIRAATGGDFTAKDFRTWTATVLATAALLAAEAEEAESEAARKRVVGNAVKTVAARLGNTPAVCRSSYIHPEILSSYMEGQLHRLSAALDDVNEDDLLGILAIEKPVLRFLRRRMTESEKADVPSRSLEQSLAASVAADDPRPS